MFQVSRYKGEPFVEVWPVNSPMQVPILPLMSVGQMIEAGDDAPFGFCYSYRYDVVQVDG